MFSCKYRTHAFWHSLALGRKKPQKCNGFPLAFLTCSSKTLFSQALFHKFLDSLPALVMILGTVMSYSARRALLDK